MKYFARKDNMWGSQTLLGVESQTYEITPEYALRLYKACHKAGQFNLIAVPKYKKGTEVSGTGFSVWGEVTTNAECFNRRLKGTLANDILNKRIADE